MKKQLITCAVISLASIVLTGVSDDTRPHTEKVYWDTVTETGEFAGGNLQLPTSSKDGLMRTGIAGVTTLIDNGPPSNRIDLVFVGDGYTLADLNDYENHVDNAIVDFFGIEPLQSYLPLFNVHRVDVISNESGVDNDPVNGIEKDTAMDMGFWCNNIERLLCIDTSLAWSFANNVASTDAILAVANSSMYGGAGYSWAEIGTFAGANAAATDIAIHEFGHSMADLADEYDYGGPVTYTGPEPSERNVSIYTASQMEKYGLKWVLWLGENDPVWDGLVDTYEGAMYSQYGIYRPTNNSMMRSLARPFNQPSVEAFILEMYAIVDPIDDSTPVDVLDGTETVFIEVIDVGHSMEIVWTLDEKSLGMDGETSVDLSTLDLPAGVYSLEVSVVDPTEWVRDEIARESSMKQEITWLVQIVAVAGACCSDGGTCVISYEEDCVDFGWNWQGDGTICEDGCDQNAEGACCSDGGDCMNLTESNCAAKGGSWLGPNTVCDVGTCQEPCQSDINGDGVVNVADLLEVIDSWGACEGCAADINQDGQVNVSDLLEVVGAWGGCP